MALALGRIRGFLLLLLLVPVFIFPVASTSDGTALILAKEKWRAHLPTWIGDDPCQNWEGVICNENLRVSALNLSNRGIEGHLPEEIGELEFLTSLDLSNSRHNSGPWNNISGDLAALGSLTNLLLLNMSFNVLTTNFPSSIVKLTNLEYLKVDNAGVTGPFPQELSKLTNLKHLYLGNNSFEGPIPPEFGNLVNLVELSLWSNELNSSIPSELSKLTKLTYLNMHGCDLWGALPPEFGDLRHMERLHLYDNSLSGTIPDTWENMRNLKSLRLQFNYLTKLFPYWTQRLPSLEHLDLEHNMLYGNVQKVNLKHLKQLDLKCNYFSGDPPTPLNMIFEDKGNCFTHSNPEDKKRCSQDFYTCKEFFKHVPYGRCAACPRNQNLQSAITCVCEPGMKNHPDSTNVVSIRKIVASVTALSIFVLVVLLYLKTWRKIRGNDFSALHSYEEIEMFLHHDHISRDNVL